MADPSLGVSVVPTGRLFLDVHAEFPAPQTVPQGYQGFWDWPDVSDEEAARRGQVAYAPPPFDREWERLEWSFTEGTDGVWTAEAKVVPTDVETARRLARAMIANRRWQAEVGGMTLPGFPARISTDREVSQAKIAAAYTKALANAEYRIEAFEIVPGTFITLDNATIIALGDAMEAHIQGGFKRAKDLNRIVDGKARSDTVRAALMAEIDTGWPGQETAGAAPAKA